MIKKAHQKVCIFYGLFNPVVWLEDRGTCELRPLRLSFTFSSPLCVAYIRQWTGSALAQVMPSHFLNQCWFIVNWTPWNKFHWNSNRNSIIFVQENASEIVVCQNGGHFVQGDELMGFYSIPPLWRYDMETLKESPATSGFLSQRSHSAQLWYFLCC